MAAFFVIPLAILLKLVTMPFERPVARTAPEVARYLRDFIEGSGGDWDFDDFSSIPIADPRLDSIRERASRFNGPESDEALTQLRALLAEAEALADEHV
jgi:hypothetical protein